MFKKRSRNVFGGRSSDKVTVPSEALVNAPFGRGYRNKASTDCGEDPVGNGIGFLADVVLLVTQNVSGSYCGMGAVARIS